MSDRITLSTHPKRVKAVLGDQVLAETEAAVCLEERGLPPRLYIPRTDVNLAALSKTERTTVCPFKGTASYYSAHDATNVAWSYETPIEGMEGITGHLAFDESKGVRLEES